MNAIPSRQPIRTTDADGTPVVRVPLARGRGFAVLFAEDFDTIASLGFTVRWCLNQGSPGYSYVRCGHPASEATGGLLSVARLIMEAAPGLCVRYRDKDRTNLRRTNLYLAEDGRAKGRERDVLALRRHRLACGGSATTAAGGVTTVARSASAVSHA